MKPKLISYARLVNTGNYEHSRIEIQVEIEEGESASDVYKKAKEFVDKRCKIESISSYKIEEARKILENKHDYKLKDIEAAEKLLNEININDDLL